MFVNVIFDMFMPPASLDSQPLFTFIYTQFLLLCSSAVMFRELGLVREMRTEVGEELKMGKAALGGDFAPQGGRLEKPPA
jgi:hypothetical protein